MALPDCQSCPQLDIFRRKRDSRNWQHHRTEIAQDDASNSDTSTFPESDCDIFIIKTKARKVRECPKCQTYFIHTFQIPDLWWEEYCRDPKGYFGCEDTLDTEGNVNGFNTWARFIVKDVKRNFAEYEWYKVNIFTRWLPSTKQTILLLFDLPSPIAERPPSQLIGDPDSQCLTDPFWIYEPLMREIVRLQDTAVAAIATQVRFLESMRTPLQTRTMPNYQAFHDLTRHTTHVSETLAVTIKTLNGILSEHASFIGQSPHASQNIQRRLLFFEHMVQGLHNRSHSNRERLTNEIQLSINVIAHYDSGVSVAIGQAAQEDSAAMKTIAFLTMTFLPPTFICAIFSMSFFNYSPESDSWSVSEKFWLYWAIAVPITVVTPLLWQYWHRFFPSQRAEEAKLA
ncbi:hypothetical protein BGZ61DRAFT_69203 [Ilyonectria robusta]|uniref:uncharacterized protein n=1 Tax=Ilyonectria robusta TaxID=1079257 RepID=UPI001E8CE94D|nr:uncharacterized protein BGZ61DRAFT_69203 [Ilyonectria robusta]KAH8679210.1 hypothetical protein BGZ61DRAFT_69203 [Ilyonectria robusta]